MSVAQAEAENINAELPPWFPAAMAATERLFKGFDSPLAERLAQMEQRFSRRNGAESIVDGLRAMVATPGLAALEALRADYAIAADDPRVQAIGEAALAFYFYLRVQDDIVDEPEHLDRAFVYVMEIFYGAAQRAFAHALGGCPEFFTFEAETMADFANAALWEVDVFRNGTALDDDLIRMGQKFLPMAIPLGALAMLAERYADLKPLTHFVTQLGIGLQMVNDALNIKEDHTSKRLTPILRWLYANGKISAADPPTNLRLALLADDAMPRALQCAKRAMAEAEAIALALGASELAAVTRNRAAFVASVPYRLFALHLGVSKL